MSFWRKTQENLIENSINGDNSNIFSQRFQEGRVYGTIYFKERINQKRGVLLVHGLSGAGHAFDVLSKRLAEYGFFVMSVDLPSNYKNPDTFTIGATCEMITDAVSILKNKFNISRVGVIGHSIGAVAAIFSGAGYNSELENNLYSLWEEIAQLIEHQGELSAKNENDLEIIEFTKKIEEKYATLKQIILDSLKKTITNHSEIDCYILLAPPLNCKKSLPGINILRRLKFSWVKKIFEKLVHERMIKKGFKPEDSPFIPEKDPRYVNMQYFKTKEVYEFLNYFLNMKEPTDFLKLIEEIIKFRKKDDKVNFFEYYQTKYVLSKPKLFIYGTNDLVTWSILPFRKQKLERFYKSCGTNVTIKRHPFTHVMNEDPKEQFSFTAIKNTKATKEIIQFLDKNI